MKSNYTAHLSTASAELELLAKREDNGKELRCEASNPALEGTLIETTTIKIECKCCCCHSLSHSLACFRFCFCCCCYYCLAPFLSLLDVAGIVSSSYRIVCLLYVFVWMCLRTCTYVWALLLSAVWRAKFNQALYTRDQVKELREQEPDVMRALLDKPSPLLSVVV